MPIEVRVPVLPESVAEGTLLNWHKKPGDAVSRDENLVDIETDKVVLEVPAPQDGVLAEILKNEGDTVAGEDVIAMLDTDAKAPAKGKGDDGKEDKKEAKGETSQAPDLSPAVRKLVAEHDLDPSKITGSGKGGRILKEDVLKYLEEQESAPSGKAKPEPEPEPEAKAEAPSRPTTEPAVPLGERAEQRVPMTRLRARIAERLVEAQHTAAMLTTFNEVNMQPVMELRKRYKDKFEKDNEGVRLGFMSFFIKAAIAGLQRYPEVNASIDGTDIVYHGYYDVGVAVSGPRGLVVPILRDCDQMSFADIEGGITEFGKKAQAGQLTMDDLTGGTFTISNGGVFGSLVSTPILNPPQSAILGMHKIQERPVVENGEIVVRPMMYLALTYDHRIIDGREAVRFLVTIKEALEDPARLLLQV
ncbi:MAG: 2-oxoglutarate dehydrogenase complex dihydrolipoyllysine-residue succinyltransferase [Gammaproteobacteria bacterium]|nr:2-oxoglutarate dehydrogenase complex dihydrolipoyllysine-residue succinyltransferase [Gammaproteobacteria bacterium]